MTKHAERVVREGLGIYQHRSYVLHLIDNEHFTALNRTPVEHLPDGSWRELAPAPVLALNGYCLDAPGEIPCGGMCAPGAMLRMPRGMTSHDILVIEQYLEQCINEILHEEN